MKIQLFQPQAIYEMGGRKNQEDSIYPLKGEATEENRVFVVCDGMGGMDKGEVASAAVRDALGKMCESLYDPQKPFTDEQFQKALQQAYDALDAADVRHEGTMGTTMTFICFHAGGCLVAHIGDSRIYHLRPSLGFPEGVRFRSRDHSLVQQLYDLGEISYHGMATSPRKNVILKAMQPYQDQRTKATFAHITDVKPGDYFYLCTDGMLEQMDDDELLGIIGNPVRTDEEKVNQLIELTQSNADNHSAYLLKVKDVEIDPVADNSLLSDERELRAKNKALNDTRKNEAWSEDVAPVPPVQDVQAEQKTAQTPPPFQPKPAGRDIKKSLLSYGIMGGLAILMLLIGIGLGIVLFFDKKGETPNPDNQTTADSVVTPASQPVVAPSTPKIVPETPTETTEAEATGDTGEGTETEEPVIGPTVTPGSL